MGIYVKDLLKSELFQDFQLIAGHGGLDNQIQGIAVMDAPDAFQWAQGREFLITTGYVFHQNLGLFRELCESGDLKKISAFGIKLHRYFDDIPDHVIATFNKFNIPLIIIPFEISWMELMNQLNVLVMNQNIRQFNIRNINPNNSSNLSYQVRKIHKILSVIEREMNFPAMLYDLTNKKAYYSSRTFLRLTEHLHAEDFWNPSFDYEKVTLCNYLNMVRYRYVDEKFDRPYSWITVPISVDDKVLAYFVVVEATELLDYFDQFIIRIGFILLQSLFEQMLIVQNIGDARFEKFITDCISGNLTDEEQIAKQAKDLKIDMNEKYYVVLMQQANPDIHLSTYKSSMKNIVYTNMGYSNTRIAFLDDNRFLFLIPEDHALSQEKKLERIKKHLIELQDHLEKRIENIQLQFGIADVSDTIFAIKRNYMRCEKAITNGKLLFPEENFFLYSALGAFAWLDVQEDEINIMLHQLHDLFKSDENKELIETLKVYLENNMNYSHTAKKLYVHINTVRNRIEQIKERIPIDLEDPFNRLQLEILLKLFT